MDQLVSGVMNLTLADLRPGQKGIFFKINSQDKTFKRRMASLGVIPGSTVELDRAAPLGDPRIYIIAGYKLGLRNADAKQIDVRLAS